ncbi:GntR family transcriptional regulator [soil metagenome]
MTSLQPELLSRPKYKVVRDRLLADIESGRLKPGDCLPTEVKMVQSLGYSRQTIRQALAELENSGLIERIQGRGTFVSTEQQRKCRQHLDMFAFIAPELQSGVYPWMLGGFQRGCESFQHQVLIGNSRDDIGRQADLLMQMMDQKVGGVALVPTTTTPTPVHQVRLLQSHGIPVVCCHRVVEGVQAPAVLISGQALALKAGQRLCEQGHRRIAFFFNHRYSMTEQYGQGLREALTAAGGNPADYTEVEYEKHGVFNGQNTETAIRASFEDLFSQPNPPTAIFCGNPPSTELVYLQAIARGMNVPRDLSLICVGSTSRENGLVGRLSMVAIDELELGACAARLLNEMRAGLRPIDNNERVIFAPSVVPGETVGPVPRT